MCVSSVETYYGMDIKDQAKAARLYARGSSAIADAYQAREKCSDKERDLMEEGVDGVGNIIVYSAAVLWIGIAIQAVAGIGKTAYKIGRFVGKHR